MNAFIQLLIIFFAATNVAFAVSQDLYPFTNDADSKRFTALIKEIRCVVCQNQNIADSNAPLANDLRTKIYQMVIAKNSNEEIKGYLTKRYGEFILLQPRFNKNTFVLWLFPLLISIFSIMFLKKKFK